MRDIPNAENDQQTAPMASGEVLPVHYTAEDIANIAALRHWLESRKFTQSALAKLARISASGLRTANKKIILPLFTVSKFR